MKVSACTIEYPQHPMEANLTSQTTMERNGPVLSHDLKVFRGKISDQLFPNTGYRQAVTFIVNGGNQTDFYYIGRDDEGYIFQTRP